MEKMQLNGPVAFKEETKWKQRTTERRKANKELEQKDKGIGPERQKRNWTRETTGNWTREPKGGIGPERIRRNWIRKTKGGVGSER